MTIRSRRRPARLAATALLAASPLAGCESFLEKPPLSAIASDQFYRTEQQAIAATNAVYDVLTPLYRRSGLLTFGDVAANTVTLPEHDVWGPFDQIEVPATNALLLDMWSNSYDGINRANAVIDRLPQASIAEGTRNRLVAEARFLRALYYFNLVRLWGGVPLPLTESTSLGGLDLPRSSEDEVYAQIVTDLKAAQPALPVAAVAAGRATQGAARALLATVYLTRRQFGDARDRAREVINSGRYNLWDEYEDAFRIANENGRESVFDAQFETLVSEGTNTPQYSLPDVLKPIAVGGGGVTREYWRSDPALIASYEAGDTRRDLNVVNSYSTATRRYTWPTSLIFKYMLDLQQVNVGDSGVNWPIIRFADVLLTFAEAENEVSGPTPAAYAALNRVRRRAFGLPQMVPSARDYAGLSQAAFRQAVWAERFRELPLEGHQWFDLKRTDRLVGTLGIPAFRALYPIPQRELEANRNMKQNPGY